MKRLLYEMAIPATLVIIISAFLFIDFSFATEQSKLIEKLTKEERAITPAQIITRKPVQYSAGSLKDPFKPNIAMERPSGITDNAALEQVNVPPPNLVIQGIIWDSNFNQAIVNNKVVKAGDTIDGAKILTINKDSIEVFFNNRKFTFTSPAGAKLAPKDSEAKK